MALEVRLLSPARQDLSEAFDFIAADSPANALKWVDEIEKRLADLGTHPHLGPQPADLDIAALGYRVLNVEKYLVFYKVGEREIIIHRILHGSRDFQQLI